MNQIHTPSQHVLVKPTLRATRRTASGNGKTVDALGFSRAMVIFSLGVHDRTDGNETLDVKLQESADNATWTDVPSAAFTQIAAQAVDATSGNIYLMDVDLSIRQRYLRGVGTAGGTTPSSDYGVNIALFAPTAKPPTQDATPVRV